MSILLSIFAREPLATRQSSAYLPYINQALETLNVMRDCRFARNIHNFVRELVDTLPNPVKRLPDNQHGTSVTFDLRLSRSVGDFGLD